MTFEIDSTNVRKIFHITFLIKVPENADHLITEHSKLFQSNKSFLGLLYEQACQNAFLSFVEKLSLCALTRNQ